jgi:two-component system alkaline phosphatase synthesis response regulator PhoP
MGILPVPMVPVYDGATMTLILVAEDDDAIRKLIRDVLEHAGFDVLVSADGAAALQAAQTRRPDLLVLDLGLPGMDGLDVARKIRRTSDLPIIMLTARAEESDTLVGLELGADDYIAKPFSTKELVARVRAVLRRIESTRAPGRLVRVADLEIDEQRMLATRAGVRIDLTASEFALLAALAASPGRVFTRAQLLDAIHGEAFEAYERAIDVHVKNIRRKLEPQPQRPRYVVTVFGVGYRLAEALELSAVDPVDA